MYSVREENARVTPGLTREWERHGWSKAALARSASLDQGLMSNIESGRIRPYPAERRRPVVALDWSTGDITGLLDDIQDGPV